MSNRDGEYVHCFFCGKTEDRVRKLLSGPNGVYICGECMALCNEILQKEFPENDATVGGLKGINLLRPREIKTFFDEYIIDQETAKRVLSVAVYSHYGRIISDTDSDAEIQKSNILMLSLTGSGKTYLAQTLAKILDVPFTIADVATFMETGYVGEDVENILLKLIQTAGDDVKRTEYSAVYTDEIDKVTKKGENVPITQDISDEGIQQALLKILEGTIASVLPQGGRKHPYQEFIQIDTVNIFSICGDTFDSLEKIVDSHLGSGGLGLNSQMAMENAREAGEPFRQVTSQDLVKYDLTSEFISRVPVTVALDLLNKNALMQTLIASKSALIKQYRRLFELDNVKLKFMEGAVREVAHLVLERKTDTRDPRAAVEGVMTGLMYEIPSDEFVGVCMITEEMIRHRAGPQTVHRESSIQRDREKPSRLGEIA